MGLINVGHGIISKKLALYPWEFKDKGTLLVTYTAYGEIWSRI